MSEEKQGCGKKFQGSGKRPLTCGNRYTTSKIISLCKECRGSDLTRDKEREAERNIKYRPEVIAEVLEQNFKLIQKYGVGCGKEISKRGGNQECRETHLCKECHEKYLFHLRIKGIIENLRTVNHLLSKETSSFDLMNAMELGYKAHEKGDNIQKARLDFNKILKGAE